MIKRLLKDNYRQVLVVIGIVIAAFFLSQEKLENEMIQDLVSTYGYVGIFVVSVISGFNLVFPIPVATFLPTFLASGLEFWYVILTISLGMAMGDTIGYFIGRAGKHMFDVHMRSIMRRLERLRENSPRLPLLFLALYATIAPFPNELVVVPLAFLGYKLRYILPILVTGNFIFNTLVAKGIIHIFNGFS